MRKYERPRVHADTRVYVIEISYGLVINAKATNQLPRARDAQIIASRVTQIAAAAEGSNTKIVALDEPAG